MPPRAKAAFDSVRRVLAERSFSDSQIEKIIPRLHEEQRQKPELLAEIIDCWNTLLSRAVTVDFMQDHISSRTIPATASPPIKSVVGKRGFNMTNILADVEPNLLLFSPEKLIQRHRNLDGLGIMNNNADHWVCLFNAPRGFYLQDWLELTKKILYIDQKVVNLLYDKREQRGIDVHPIVSFAAVTEADFDHIRTRYLFAERTGYASLSHMRPVQTASSRPTLKDMILVDDESYLSKFAPFCSLEEFSSFSNLIKNYELDEEDSELFTKLAELDSLRHPSTHSVCQTQLDNDEID